MLRKTCRNLSRVPSVPLVLPSGIENNLNLNGLIKLSDTAAESFSKFEGYSLGLSGLRELSDSAAESLSQYKGNLNPLGLSEPSGMAAKNPG